MFGIVRGYGNHRNSKLFHENCSTWCVLNMASARVRSSRSWSFRGLSWIRFWGFERKGELAAGRISGLVPSKNDAHSYGFLVPWNSKKQVYIFRTAIASLAHPGKSQMRLYPRDMSLSDDHTSPGCDWLDILYYSYPGSNFINHDLKIQWYVNTELTSTRDKEVEIDTLESCI